MSARILIVEDEEVVREPLASFLRGKGYTVITAEDGETGLRMATESDGCDLVLTDLSMPKMDGLSFLRRLHSIAGALPVVVITGHATVENAIEALKEGAADFVTKPLQFKELSQSIGRILEQRARTRRRHDALRLSTGFKLDLTYETAKVDIRAIRHYIEDILGGLDCFSQVEATNMTLAFEEAVTNAYEHGNLELDSQIKSAEDRGWEVYNRLRQQRAKEPRYARRKIFLHVRWDPPCLELRVRDQGRGFDHRLWAPQTDYTKCHGRGLTIIYGVMDEVEFNRKGTQITMRKFARTKREDT